MRETPWDNAKIYVITDGKRVYIGSTITDDISKCLWYLHTRFKKYKNKTNLQYHPSFYVLDSARDHAILLLETYPCTSKRELKARVEYWKEKSPMEILSIVNCE